MKGSLEKLRNPIVRDFIARARIGHLATASLAAMPHNIPLCFCFDGLHFYFAIDQKPKRQSGTMIKRLRNITENPRVALVIDHYEENWHELAYVLVSGRAEVVPAGVEYEAVLESLLKKYPQYRTMEFDPQRNPVARIDPDNVHVWGSRFADAQES